MSRSINIKSLTLTISALILSNSAGAATITYNDFSHDESTSIVNGGGLEWMQWSATKGMSVDSALATYAASGWRLATNYEMTHLLNTFYSTDYFQNPDDIPGSQYLSESNTYAEEGTASYEFTRIFGMTHQDAVDEYDSNTLIVEELRVSRAFFGANPGQPGSSLFANVQDDFKFKTCNRATNNVCTQWAYYGTNIAGSAASIYKQDGFYYDGTSLNGDYITDFSTNISNAKVGVALVRGEELSAVPVPAAVWLFGSGLIGLFGVARRKA